MTRGERTHARRLAVAVLATVVAFGCSGGAVGGATATSSATAPSPTGEAAAAPTDPGALREQMLAVMEDACGGCHDEGMPAPPLGRLVLDDRVLAMRSALMLANQRMPPAPTALAPATRADLIGWLCDVSAAGPNCRANLTPPAAHEFVRDPRSFLREAQRLGGLHQDSTDAEKLVTEMLQYFQQDKRIFRLTPTYQLLMTLKAADRCAPVPSAAAAPASAAGATEAPRPPDSATVDRACMATLLGAPIVALPPPASQIVPD